MASKVQSDLRNFLHACRTVSIVWALVGAIVALVGILGFFFSLFMLRFSADSLFLFFYGGLWMFTCAFIHIRCQSWIPLAESAQYAVLRERMLVWVVLGLLFGVISGLLLLIVYLHTDLAENAESPTAPVSTPPPPSNQTKP
jgi:uncharacterized membrane protein YeaQ/YmgE (transglycosylase-associated protein family)